MADALEQITGLLHEVEELHGRVFRIVHGDHDDWASWYAWWLAEWSELPKIVPGKVVRSELVYLLVDLDKRYNAESPQEPWQPYYAREILEHFRARPA
jgi:hypothetical protein